MSGLARRYERLLRCYPRAHRLRHGEEMTGVLLDGARPGQRWPRPAEVVNLLAGAALIWLRRRPGGVADPGWRAVWSVLAVTGPLWWLAAALAIQGEVPNLFSTGMIERVGVTYPLTDTVAWHVSPVYAILNYFEYNSPFTPLSPLIAGPALVLILVLANRRRAAAAAALIITVGVAWIYQPGYPPFTSSEVLAIWGILGAFSAVSLAVAPSPWAGLRNLGWRSGLLAVALLGPAIWAWHLDAAAHQPWQGTWPAAVVAAAGAATAAGATVWRLPRRRWALAILAIPAPGCAWYIAGLAWDPGLAGYPYAWVLTVISYLPALLVCGAVIITAMVTNHRRPDASSRRAAARP